MGVFGSDQPRQQGVYAPAITRQLNGLKDAPVDSIVESARRIFGWLPPQGSFKKMALRYLEAAEPIMKAGEELPATSAHASHLLGALAYLYADSLPIVATGKNEFASLLERSEELKFMHPSAEARLAAQRTIAPIERLSTAYLEKESAIKAIRTLIPSVTTIGMDAEELVGVIDSVAALAMKIGECRRIGVKPCFMQDGILHPAEMAWVFLDGCDEMSKLPPKYHAGLRWPLAVTHLAKRADIRELKTSLQRLDAGQGELLALSSVYKREMKVVVQFDGTLTLDLAHGLWPLDRVFEQAGRADVYPAFWLAHLLRLSDLIVPESIRRGRSVPDWPSIPPNRRDREEYLAGIAERFRRLRIPRQRMLEDIEAIRLAQQEELSAAKEFTEGISSLGVTREVTGYFRRLPEGYQVSPQAIELALKERKMPPPEGHTYVKTYEWGIGPQALGHIARRRQRRTTEE